MVLAEVSACFFVGEVEKPVEVCILLMITRIPSDDESLQTKMPQYNSGGSLGDKAMLCLVQFEWVWKYGRSLLLHPDLTSC